MASEIKLKPCPFCGAKARRDGFRNTFYVECEKCKCCTQIKARMCDAVRLWNRRAGNGE